MSHSIEWIDQDRKIVLQKYFDQIKHEDFYDAVDKSAKMISSVEHIVDIIIDMREAKTDLKGFFQAASYANKKVPDNQGVVVVIGASRFTQMMVKVAESIAPKATEDLYFVDTLEEAMRIIEARRGAQNQRTGS